MTPILSRWMSDPPPIGEHRPSPDPTPRRVLLVNPFYPKDRHASFGKHVLTPTLALTSVAGATPAGWDVAYWDENLLQGPPPVDPMPQVVGISVHLTFAERAYRLADEYRRRGAVVVLGGLHVLSCPDEARPHADALAIGEGVQLWPRILDDIAHGRLRGEYRGSFTQPYRDDPAPDRSILPRRHFLTTASLIATRGCHNRCGFCYLATDGLHMPYQVRDAEQIAREFVDEDQPYGVFIDNNLGSRRSYLHVLCDTLEPLDKIWSAAVSIDVTDDPELIARMAAAGCTGVFVGFESLSDTNIRGARKKSPLTSDYARRVDILHDHGIQVNGSFVLGFDDDDESVFERTTSWIESVRLECATFHVLTPYPGTPLFRRLKGEGRILHEDWSRYDTAHVVFEPAKMSAERLIEGYSWCYRRLFSMSSIWHRRPDEARAVLPYLAMSLLYKRSNWLWPLLIKSGMTATAWRPLVEWSRRRHVKARKRRRRAEGAVVSAGV